MFYLPVIYDVFIVERKAVVTLMVQHTVKQ